MSETVVWQVISSTICDSLSSPARDLIGKYNFDALYLDGKSFPTYGVLISYIIFHALQNETNIILTCWLPLKGIWRENEVDLKRKSAKSYAEKSEEPLLDFSV